MSEVFVFDAWALLAMLQKEEPAATRVLGLLQQALGGEVELFVSIINLGEVVYRVGKAKGEDQAAETLAQIRHLPLTILPATDDAVWAAVEFKIRHAISYPDAFAAAATEGLGATLVTGDPELLSLEGGITVEKLERAPRV